MAVRKIPISEYYYRKREIDAFLNGKSDDDHTHGNIGNNGAVNNDTDAVNKIVVTDSSNMIKTINTLPLDKVTHQDISGKVNTSDIKNDLTSTDTNKPLSASQGNVLKGLVDSKATNTHNHGNINNNGTITTGTNDVNKIMVTDSSDTIKTIDTLPANKVIHQDISGKVNTSDIKNNLTSTDTDKPLSAKQGNELKTLVDSKANSNDVYTKNETMSAEDIRSAIAESIGDIDIFEVVSTLPTSNIKKNKFYLTPNGENIEKNVYDINIYINNKWETIDSLEFDISNYPTKSEITILLNGKVDKIDGKQLSTNDFTNALKNKLENQVLTQHQSLANYIQKSQTQGLVKNDGTIDTNEYLTIETMPKPFNYGFIDSDLVLHIMYIGTDISVTKTIMQNGENNPITVIVSDEKGNLLEDMPVEFYIDGVKVGQTINTNSNGVASYTYQGNGFGKIEVQVKIGSFVSGTFIVDDTYKYDLATITKHTDFWTKVYGDEEFTRGAEYSTLSEGTTGSASIRTILPFNEWEVVFDAKNDNATSEWIVGLYQYGVGVTGVGLGVIDTWTNIRLVYDGTNVKIYKNGEYWLTRELTFDKIAPVYFQFQTPGTVTTVDFKNFKVYGNEITTISDTGIEGTATNIYDNVTANALTRTTEYTSLKEVTTGTNVLAYISNLPSAFVMDFELYQVDGPTGTGIINIYSDSTYKSYFSLSYISETVGKWLNLRLYVSEGTAILLNKDNLKYTRTNTFTGTANRVAFVTGGDTSELRWKNVQVHPI